MDLDPAELDKELSKEEQEDRQSSPPTEPPTRHASFEDDVEKAAEQTPDQAQGTSQIVDWNGPDDPENPVNFSTARKWLYTMALSLINITTTFASSIFSSANKATAHQFHVSEEVMVLGTSLFMVGFVIGPSVWGPLSELYGRKIPLYTGFFIFALFQIPVAVASNLETVMVCRFLQGLFGVAASAVVPGHLADFWNSRERGYAFAAFSASLFVGPIFGPIVGAFVVESYLGWRWVEWINLIMALPFGAIAFLIVPETYPPVLLAKRAQRLRHRTGNWALHARHEEREIDLKDIGNRYLLRPIRMFFQEPILLLVTLYMAFVFGLLYLFFEALPVSYINKRGMSPGIGSLPFIGVLIGVLIACLLIAFTTKTRLAPNPAEGRYQETRLITMMMAAVALPVGLFWFGWTSFPSISPWPQIISGAPVGFAILIVILQGMNYIIDCYGMVANSALAANTLVRSGFAAGFPLFATAMYDNLGVPWASSVLGFIAVALAPVPFLFYIFGARIRKLSRYVPE